MKNADKQVEHHNPNKKAVPCMSETELKQLPFTSQSENTISHTYGPRKNTFTFYHIKDDNYSYEHIQTIANVL